MDLRLPPELLLKILELALDKKRRNPIPLLLVNSEFHNLCLSILHSALRFTSIRQLDCFVRTCRKLVLRPRDLLITLPGGTADFRLFKLLHDLVLHIMRVSPQRSELAGFSEEKAVINNYVQKKFWLRRIQLCLNSHIFDENCRYLTKALELTDPEEFIWTGPDPAHHFSIAIVPIAASYLFKAMRTWTNLRHLKLTNMAYPRSDEGGHVHALAAALGVARADPWVPQPSDPEDPEDDDQVNARQTSSSASPPKPHLQTIYLGQVTFFDPSEIARIACAPELVSLRGIRVIDAYQGSIWGLRVRNADIERAASALLSLPTGTSAGTNAGTGGQEGPDDIQFARRKASLERAKELVSCEALTERIMGGDRMDFDN